MSVKGPALGMARNVDTVKDKSFTEVEKVVQCCYGKLPWEGRVPHREKGEVDP